MMEVSLRIARLIRRGLEADLLVAHRAFDLGLRHERGDGVDDDDVDGVGAHEHLGDVEGLLAAVGLGDEEVVEVDAEFFGVGRVEGVFGVDEGRDAAGALGAGYGVQAQRGLARTFGAENFDDAAARQALAAEGDVERVRAGRDAVDDALVAVAQAHDRAAAELFFDLRERHVQRVALVLFHVYAWFFLGHYRVLV